MRSFSPPAQLLTKIAKHRWFLSQYLAQWKPAITRLPAPTNPRRQTAVAEEPYRLRQHDVINSRSPEQPRPFSVNCSATTAMVKLRHIAGQDGGFAERKHTSPYVIAY